MTVVSSLIDVLVGLELCPVCESACLLGLWQTRVWVCLSCCYKGFWLLLHDRACVFSCRRMLRVASCMSLLLLFKAVVGLPWFQTIGGVLVFYLGSGGWKFMKVFYKTIGRDVRWEWTGFKVTLSLKRSKQHMAIIVVRRAKIRQSLYWNVATMLLPNCCKYSMCELNMYIFGHALCAFRPVPDQSAEMLYMSDPVSPLLLMQMKNKITYDPQVGNLRERHGWKIWFAKGAAMV